MRLQSLIRRLEPRSPQRNRDAASNAGLFPVSSHWESVRTSARVRTRAMNRCLGDVEVVDAEKDERAGVVVVDLASGRHWDAGASSRPCLDSAQ